MIRRCGSGDVKSQISNLKCRVGTAHPTDDLGHMSTHEPDNQVLGELPPYAGGRRECPECGSDAVRECKVDSRIVVPHLPMACDRCGHTWTPHPSRWQAVLYLSVGWPAVHGFGARWARDFGHDAHGFMQSDSSVGLVQTGLVCLMGVSGLTFGLLGIACLRAGLHYRKS